MSDKKRCFIYLLPGNVPGHGVGRPRRSEGVSLKVD